ncbi:MAG: phosphoribosylformylglycinamidine synthase subunit PurS [Candidatus Ancaeobacter aquaticus]|nr:phosphoribosylformylglycinamidine synthase subunit PurS [Candidatus Ancaeobacter aquaticus]
MRAKIYVTLKKSVLDPQGVTIRHALESLGFKTVNDVRMGKYFEVELSSKDKKKAEKEINEMCKKLLVNPVIEEYKYDLLP